MQLNLPMSCSKYYVVAELGCVSVSQYVVSGLDWGQTVLMHAPACGVAVFGNNAKLVAHAQCRVGPGLYTPQMYTSRPVSSCPKLSIETRPSQDLFSDVAVLY